MEAQVSSGIPPHWLKPSVSDTEHAGADYATLGDPHDTHSQGGTLAPLHTEPLAPLQQDTERASDEESSDLDYLDGVGSHPDLAPVGNGIISDGMEGMGGDDDSFKIKGGPNSESSWSNEETVALINAVKENYQAIKKKQRNKLMNVWAPRVAARLQQQGYSKSAEQCHVKWKNLLHKFRELKEQSARNRGRFMDPPRLWPFFRMIEEIIGKNGGFSDRSLSASRFVMYVPPGTKTPNPIYANTGTAIRPYPDVTSTLSTTTPYYYTGVGSGTGGGISVGGGAQTGATTTGVAEQAMMDAGGALKRSHDDMMFGGGGVPSTQLALVSEKLDRVIYLLEKQIELQESLARIKRQRLDDLGDGGEGLSDTETES